MAMQKEEYAFEHGRVKLTHRDLLLFQCSYRHIPSFHYRLRSLAQWADKQKNWYLALKGALEKLDLRESKRGDDWW
jgi:hypothetical protein